MNGKSSELMFEPHVGLDFVNESNNGGKESNTSKAISSVKFAIKSELVGVRVQT